MLAAVSDGVGPGATGGRCKVRVSPHNCRLGTAREQEREGHGCLRQLQLLLLAGVAVTVAGTVGLMGESTQWTAARYVLARFLTPHVASVLLGLC
jgi:hypothetical protein